MPSSRVEKAVVGAGAVLGAGLLAWRTQFPWIKHDIQYIKAGKMIMDERKNTVDVVLVDKFEEHASAHPEKAMVIYEDCVYTYAFIDQQANRVANIMRRIGLKFGDTVAMVIHNDPSFIWTLLGLQKLGIAAALVNFNLRLKHLSHSILATEPSAVIVGPDKDLHGAVREVLGDLGKLPVYVQGLTVGEQPAPGLINFDSLMLQALPVRPSPSLRQGIKPGDIMCYIYTSGTTGLPKPVFISHMKAVNVGLLMLLVGLNPSDRIYTCLPLYHSSGGGLGLFSVLYKGCSMVLRNKFSASRFWSDCRKHNVTVIQYIGEIFRYILAQPPHELDKVHSVRAAFGNGMRKDIFEEVQKRFNIPQICEFFGATEGVTALFNLANKPGAIGRMSPFLNAIDPDPKVLVKYDLATATPLRDSNGRCMKIKPGESGLFIARVPDVINANGSLTVYKASKEANDKKLVHGAFKEGDLYFNFGDVFYMDYDYFVYFQDRIGDTFRWKGENVSTTEVANVFSTLDFILDANVYGVTIPGHDGRAGMAALSLHGNSQSLSAEQLAQVYELCHADLPSYARPLFLRVLREAVLTGTFKQRKVELRDEGYDLDKVSGDALYYLDAKAGAYLPLTSPQALVSFLSSKL